MEFIPRTTTPAPAAQPAVPIDARQRAIRDIGVAAVAAALGLAEGASTHAHTAIPMPLPRAA